ncbi:hypothetical protein [Microbacterium album]|uniref:Uncharacterized protein n=1 Tax=Microbacterium album TaxID=2053191 RepID=A0A917IFE8_9MICO|nr:hypothetical protein [Microbacterium album]GGH47938.1 hypothetical protein GCM10010921_25040 [Microbacterium album]
MSEADTDRPDDKTLRDAEEANRIATEHGVADPGGFPTAQGATWDGETPVDRPAADQTAAVGPEKLPIEDIADDPFEETGPPQ